MLSDENCSELEFTVEKSLKQNGYTYSLATLPYQKLFENLIIKLSRPSILHKLVMRRKKSSDVVCNLKTFHVMAGLTENSCDLLLEGSLKADFEVEEFILRNKIDGSFVPCQFLKICPLQCWESNVKFDVPSSLTLFGLNDHPLVDKGVKSYQEHQHQMAARLCLKFLRDSGYNAAFDVVSSSLGVSVEHPVVSQLYHHLVELGDYKKTEVLLEESFNNGFCEEYIVNQHRNTEWEEIKQTIDAPDWPVSRGGHQICVDPNVGSFYLFGGWNGSFDLSDLWKFDVKSRQWTCISSDTSKQGGPSARSCHKMCIDLRSQKLYTIGKYLEHQKRIPENLKNDFYSYDVESNEWTLLSEDTLLDGGPPLVFDHQVTMDEERGVIYVFGGNTLISTIASEEHHADQSSVSSLYMYNINTKAWCLLRRTDPVLSTRIGHSLLYHSQLKYLFIFAGMQIRQSVNDLQVYDTTDLDDIKRIEYLSVKDFLPAPMVGFTHRSTLDTELNEIYVLTGINKETASEKSRDLRQNSLWIYNICRGTWQCVYNYDIVKNQSSSFTTHHHPLPRFAHQFVYDSSAKVHYLFGGNPNQDYSDTRLNDLWSLKLTKAKGSNLLRDMKYLVRKHCYKEMVHIDSTEALLYLQNDLYMSLCLSNQDQLSEFETLPSLLFKSYKFESVDEDPGLLSAEEIKSNRLELFHQVTKFFPDSAKQPGVCLLDLVPRRPWDPLCAIQFNPTQ